MIPSAVAAGAIVVGMANGAIAASFSVSGQSFKVSADNLNGTGFKQYGGADVTAGGQAIPVAVSEISQAELTNLCQTVDVKNPFGVKIVLRIEAGKGPKKADHVTAKNLQIGMTELSGDATFTNIDIGRDGGELATGKADGSFGQAAEGVDIDGLKQIAYSTHAGTFALKGLTMKVLVGGDAKECF
nr:DUF6230 family protein [Micromonospora sp. NBRC 107566]